MVKLRRIVPAIVQAILHDGSIADPLFCAIFVVLAGIIISSATNQYNGLITALARHNSSASTSVADIPIAHVQLPVTQGSDAVQGGLAIGAGFITPLHQHVQSQPLDAKHTIPAFTSSQQPHSKIQAAPTLDHSPNSSPIHTTAAPKPTKNPSEQHHAIFGYFRTSLRNIAKTEPSRVDHRTAQVEEDTRLAPSAAPSPEAEAELPPSRVVCWFKWFGQGISRVTFILGLCAIPFIFACLQLLRSKPACPKCGDVLQRYQGLLASFTPNNLRLLQQAPAIIQSQRDEISNVKAAFRIAEDRAAQLDAELKEVEHELEEERQFSKDMETSVAAVWNIAESEKRSRKGLQEKLDEATHRVWNLQSELEDTNRVNAELKAHIERLTELFEQKAAEHKRTLILLDDFSEADLTHEQEELGKLRKQLEEKVNELLLGQYEHHMVHLRLAEVQKTLEAVRQENQKLREELKNARDMLLDAQSESSSDPRKDELVREVKSLKLQLKDQAKELKAERLTSTKQRKDMETLQQNLATAEDRLKLAEEAMEARQVVPRLRTRSRHPRT